MAKLERWTEEEDAILGSDSDVAVAKQLGRSARAVTLRRTRLGIAPGVNRGSRREWTKKELALLGTMPDGKLAAQLGVSRKHVFETRLRMGIVEFRKRRCTRK